MPYRPHHEGAKQDNIGVIGRTSAKLPFHRGLALTYSMENEMTFVHHVIEQQGCGYTMEDNERLNDRTQGHPKMKPKSRLI